MCGTYVYNERFVSRIDGGPNSLFVSIFSSVYVDSFMLPNTNTMSLCLFVSFFVLYMYLEHKRGPKSSLNISYSSAFENVSYRCHFTISLTIKVKIGTLLLFNWLTPLKVTFEVTACKMYCLEVASAPPFLLPSTLDAHTHTHTKNDSRI